MNSSLFIDLHRFINTDITERKFKADEFFDYLIGHYSLPIESINYEISDDVYKKVENIIKDKNTKNVIKLRDIFKSSYSEMLKRNKSLRLQDLFRYFSFSLQDTRQALENIASKLNDIKNLYQTHAIPLPTEQDAEKLLLHLFTVCVTEYRERLFASYKNQQLKPSTIKSILGREDDAKKLRDALNTYHKIIISDQYGSGKSYFMQYCLNQWNPKDFCYLYYKNNENNKDNENLEFTLAKIKYWGEFAHSSYNAEPDELMDKASSSPLLIIDNMYYSSNFSQELEVLSQYPIDIIVITIKNVETCSFHPFTMSTLPDETLKKVFEHSSELSLEDDLCEKMLSLTQKNLLMISLIATQCKKAAESLSKSICQRDIIEKALFTLSTLDNHTEINFKYKHSSDKKTLDLIGHIKSIYNTLLDPGESRLSNAIKRPLQDIMKYLCCFGWSPIPLSFLYKILPFCKQKDLETLSDLGLLLLTADSVQLTSLISHAVFAKENPTPRDYDFMVENLIQFLKEYDQTLSVPYLSDTLFMFIDALYEDVPTSNNGDMQQKTSKSFEEWQNLLYLAVNYYNHCGEFSLANKIATQLHYPERLKNAHNFLDKHLFLLGNCMKQPENKEIAERIDEICNILFNNPFSLKDLDLSFFLIDTMDIAIGFYCKSAMGFIENHFIFKSCIIIKKILDFHACEFPYIKMSISDEQLFFYIACFNLLVNPNMIGEPTYFQKYKLKKTDYHIRTTALTFIIQSQYIICTFQNPENSDSYIDNGTIRPDIASFYFYLSKMILQLNNQILNCKLIPFLTTWLCFLSYINALILQRLLLQNNILFEPIFDITENTINELLQRCSLSKKDRDDIIFEWNKYFPHS